MDKNGLTMRETVSELAERMIQLYVRDLVSVDELMERLKQTGWKNASKDALEGTALETLVRGLCSQVLCEACRQPEGHLRNLAFKRLWEYLQRALGDACGTSRSTANEVREEVLQQTFVEILQSMRGERGKPEEPRAFLGWARVILYRQRNRYWRRKGDVEQCSLETEDEQQFIDIADEHAPDPLLIVLQRERRAELNTYIASLRNPNYRAVLSNIYLREMEASEVAHLLEVPITDIYLWHHRGILALQKQANTSEKQRFSV